MPERDRRRLAMIAAHFVRVRRAELALHLPDEIGQLAARGHAVEQRRIAFVDARSSRCPTCSASRSDRAAAATLRAASAAIRRAARPTARTRSEVDPAALARRRVRLRRRIGRFQLAVGGNGAQPLAFADHQRRCRRRPARSDPPCRAASPCAAFRSRRARGVPALPCGRRGRARRRSAAASRSPCCRRRRRSGRSVLRAPETAPRAARCRRDRRARRRGSRLALGAPWRGSSGLSPFGGGSNGGGTSACSAIRYGRAARGKLSSNWTASYTGSNVRIDRKYRYLPSGIERGRVVAELRLRHERGRLARRRRRA